MGSLCQPQKPRAVKRQVCLTLSKAEKEGLSGGLPAEPGGNQHQLVWPCSSQVSIPIQGGHQSRKLDVWQCLLSILVSFRIVTMSLSLLSPPHPILISHSGPSQA